MTIYREQFVEIENRETSAFALVNAIFYMKHTEQFQHAGICIRKDPVKSLQSLQIELSAIQNTPGKLF